MFHSDKNIGKIKRSNKSFEGREKDPWNKVISKEKNTKKKILPPQKKEVLNSYNI